MDAEDGPAPGPGDGHADSTPSSCDAGKSRSGRVRAVPNFAAMAAGTVERGESPRVGKLQRTPTKAARSHGPGTRESGSDEGVREGGPACPRTPLGAGGKGDTKEWYSPPKGSPGSLGKGSRDGKEGKGSESAGGKGRKGRGSDKSGDALERNGGEDDDNDDDEEDEDYDNDEVVRRSGRGNSSGRLRDGGWASSGGQVLEGDDIDEETGLPFWVKDSEFLTEPLEGHKAYYILHNREKFRSHFLARDKDTQLFATYDRHPPDTALDPQSGVVYFIRTEEGLQDKAISLKSVASGPTKHTWKMAWGRKTHLKKWGILYKSYRCRQIWQPRDSPPPYRMQIYCREEHDPDLTRGDAPAPGHVLVQILSLDDAPLRRRSGLKREAEEMEDMMGSVEGTPVSLAHSGSRRGHSPALHSYPSTASRSSPFRSVKPSLAPAPHRLDMGQGGEGAWRPSARRRLQQGHGSGSLSPGEERRSIRGALAANPVEHHAPGEGGGAEGRVLKAARTCHAMAAAALPVQAGMLQEQYGGLGTAVLAGMLSGQPWGLGGLLGEERGAGYPLGSHGSWVLNPDYTAFGWAELIYLHAAREAGERQRQQGSRETEEEEEELEDGEEGGEERARKGLRSLWEAVASHDAVEGSEAAAAEDAQPDAGCDSMEATADDATPGDTRGQASGVQTAAGVELSSEN